MASFPSGVFSDVVLKTETFRLDISAGTEELAQNVYYWLGCTGGPSWLNWTGDPPFSPPDDPEYNNWFDSYGNSFYGARQVHSVTVETHRQKRYPGTLGRGFFDVYDFQVITAWTIVGTANDGTMRTVTRTASQVPFPQVGGGGRGFNSPMVFYGVLNTFTNGTGASIQATGVGIPGMAATFHAPTGFLGTPVSYTATETAAFVTVNSQFPVVAYSPEIYNAGLRAIGTGYGATVSINTFDGHVSGTHSAQGYAAPFQSAYNPDGALPAGATAEPFPGVNPSGFPLGGAVTTGENGFVLGTTACAVVWPEAIKVGTLAVTNLTNSSGAATSAAVPSGSITTTRGSTSIMLDSAAYNDAGAELDIRQWGGYRFLKFHAAVTPPSGGGTPVIYLWIGEWGLNATPGPGANGYRPVAASLFAPGAFVPAAPGAWWAIPSGGGDVTLDLAHPAFGSVNVGGVGPALANGISGPGSSAPEAAALLVAIDLAQTSVTLSGFQLVEQFGASIQINSALLNGGYADAYAQVPITPGGEAITLPDPTMRVDPPGSQDTKVGHIEEAGQFTGTGLTITRDRRTAASVFSNATESAGERAFLGYTDVNALAQSLNALGNGFSVAAAWNYDDFEPGTGTGAPLCLLPMQDARHTASLPPGVAVTFDLCLRARYANFCPWFVQTIPCNQMPWYSPPTVTGLAYDDVAGGPARGPITFQCAHKPATGSPAGTLGTAVAGVPAVTVTPLSDGSFSAVLGPVRAVQTIDGNPFLLPFASGLGGAFGLPFDGLNITMTNGAGQSETQYFPWAGPYDFIGLRLFALPYSGRQYPWNAKHPRGHYHRIRANSMGPDYSRSDYAYPSVFAVMDAAPGSGPGDSQARVAVGARWETVCVFQRARTGGNDVYRSVSYDDGATWSTPALVIPGGTHPTLSVGHNGVIVTAAYVAGEIMATIQQPGDASPSSVFAFVDHTGAALAVADDSFHFVQGHSPSAPWVLHVLIAGEAATSEWASYDECATWNRISATDAGGADLVTAGDGSNYVTHDGTY